MYNLPMSGGDVKHPQVRAIRPDGGRGRAGCLGTGRPQRARAADWPGDDLRLVVNREEGIAPGAGGVAPEFKIRGVETGIAGSSGKEDLKTRLSRDGHFQ